MAKQSFLLVSLQEEKAKELAQVISNDSCRKILNYLSEKQDATESELAQKLNIPISTVHYNLQHLVKASILSVEEFHYSEKGKEVLHYKLANKYIVIAPKSIHGIKEKLRSILPVGLFAIAGAGIIQLYTKYLKPAAFIGAQSIKESARNIDKVSAPLMQEAADEVVVASASKAAEEVVTTTAEAGANIALERAPEAISQTLPNVALWFLFGCLFVIVLLVIIELIKSKKE